MNALLEHIRGASDHLALRYHVNIAMFFAVYLISFLPFYLGYLLVIQGATRAEAGNGAIAHLAGTFRCRGGRQSKKDRHLKVPAKGVLILLDTRR